MFFQMRTSNKMLLDCQMSPLSVIFEYYATEKTKLSGSIDTQLITLWPQEGSVVQMLAGLSVFDSTDVDKL